MPQAWFSSTASLCRTSFLPWRKNVLQQALQRCATMHEAAQMLGMHPTTLWRKLAQHNMGQEGKA